MADLFDYFRELENRGDTGLFSENTAEGLSLEVLMPGTEKDTIKVSRHSDGLKISYIPRKSTKAVEKVIHIFDQLRYDFKKIKPVYKNGVLYIFIGYSENMKNEYEVV